MTKDNRDNVDEVEDALKKNLKPAFFCFFEKEPRHNVTKHSSRRLKSIFLAWHREETGRGDWDHATAQQFACLSKAAL